MPPSSDARGWIDGKNDDGICVRTVCEAQDQALRLLFRPGRRIRNQQIR